MAISPSSEEHGGGHDQLWSEFLTRISTMVTKQTLETWFKPMRLASIQERKIGIECPSKFFMDWVLEHHEDKICYVFKELLDYEPELTFSNTNETADVLMTRKPELARLPVVNRRNGNGGEQLNPKYTFDEFVAGSNSRMTYAACLAVAEKPATVYNPLFIYGGVGLGKTNGSRSTTARPRCL